MKLVAIINPTDLHTIKELTITVPDDHVWRYEEGQAVQAVVQLSVKKQP